MFLLAESVSIDLSLIKTIISIVGPLLGIAGTLAVMKWRQGQQEKQLVSNKKSAEKKTDKLEQVDERIFSKIDDLGKTMQRRFNAQDAKAASAEKSMIGKLENFQSKVFNRLDDVQAKLSDQDKRLTVAETEARHTRETVEKHGKKITVMRKSPFHQGKED